MKIRKLIKFALLSFFAVMIFVACKPTTHTITLNADNGSALTTQSVVNGSVLVEPTDPSKTHYTFDYWYSSNPDVPYVFAAPVTSSFTLTAKYSPIVFVATYVNNNGTANTVVNVNSGTTLTAPTSPVKAHYTFDYWYTTDEATQYNFTTPVTANITLNAKYHHTVFNITFDKNNGSSNVVEEVLSGTAVEEPEDPVKQHFTFDYWYSTDINTPYNFSSEVVSSFTLTAKYSPIVLTITYNNQGTLTEVNINSGNVLTAPTNPTKEHYDFNYWYAGSDDGVAYVFTTPVTSSFSLTAKFTIRQYTITINPRTDLGQLQAYTVTVNSGTLLTRPVLDPIRPDSGSTFYTFDYWYKNNDSSNAYNFESIVTSSFELKAKFTGTVTFVVTFNPGNGSDSFTQIVNENDTIEIPDNPVKENYTFQYWYISDENVAFLSTTPILSELTLNAKYIKTVYTVTFEKDNGDDEVLVQVESGDTTSALSDPTKAAEAGTSYVFSAWYEIGSSTPFNFANTITSDIELMAHYTVYHRVTFMADGAEHSFATVEAGQTATSIAGPSKTNYTFNYWYSTDINTAFNFASAINAPTVLTAKYTMITYTVTFEPLNGHNTTEVIVNSGEKVSAIANPEKAPSGITTYTFAYWYTTDESIEFDFDSSVLSDITLHAKYDAVDAMDANTLAKAASWGAYEDNISTDKDELYLYAGPDKNYTVGDDNPFLLPVEAIYVDAQAVDYTLTKYNRTLALYVKDGGVWVPVTDQSLYITEDEDNKNAIDFKESAIGEIFKIVITLTNDVEESITLSDIKVENGYNIYTEDHLLSVSGYALSASAGPLATIISDRNTVNANAIFLHNKIEVTSKSYPAEITETNLPVEDGPTLTDTYLQDNVALYAFTTNGTSSFYINGNFFTIDGSNIPLVVRDGGNQYATPSTNFGVNSALITIKSNTSATIKNINIIGNSRYSDDVLDKGGYIGMYLAGNITSDLVNVHMRYAQTALVPVTLNNTECDDINLNYTVLTNMFSLGIYNDSCDLYIQNSILKTFGGMAIAMADYANNPNPSSGGSRPNPIPMILSIDDNSQIVSNVVGNEAWFNVNNMTAIAMRLKGEISSVIAPFGKTIANGDYINFIAIVTVEAPGSNSWLNCNAYANVTIDNSVLFEQNPTDDTEYGPLLSSDIYEGFGAAGGMLETSAGGLIYDYDGFNARFDNFKLKTPEQVMPYIIGLRDNNPQLLQELLINHLVVFDVNVAWAAQILSLPGSTPQEQQAAAAILSAMPAKVAESEANTKALKDAGNGYLFIKTKFETNWVGILVEMYDLPTP